MYLVYIYRFHILKLIYIYINTMVSVRNHSRKGSRKVNRSRNRSRKVKRSRNRSRKVKRSINRSRKVKRSRRIINSKRTKRIQKKSPRKQRAYMKLFKGGVLKYENSGINSSDDTLSMNGVSYTLLKKIDAGRFGVKFFKNDVGEQIIVKEIPKGREADHANKIIHDLELMEETCPDFIVRVLDDGYVYKDNPSVSGDQVESAYMYAMEPCSRDLLYNVKYGPVNITIIDGFLDAFNKLHGLGYVHGDIKPENALLCNGVVKVGDIDTIYPNETVIKWINTPLFTPYHMLPQFTDKKHSTELPTGRLDRAEYPETYHLLKQDKLNTTVDRWAMGMCVYEFYVGWRCLRSKTLDIKVLETMCWRIHNDLCHYYVTGELPNIRIKCGCFAIMDSSKLNPSMEEGLLKTMTQYCLSDKVRNVLDSIKKKEVGKRQSEQKTGLSTQQPNNQQSLLKQKENLISEIKKEIKELNLKRSSAEYYIKLYNKDLNKLKDERSELNVKREKVNEEYKPVYDRFDEVIEDYEKKRSESEDTSSLEEGIAQMEKKKKRIQNDWNEKLSEIDSELAIKEPGIKELEKLIKEYSKNLDDINNELKQKQQQGQELREKASERPDYYG
jgi:serine/threonine protein kinase